MIEISELAFRYSNRRSELASIFGMRIDTFTVPQGSSTALVGPSGSGKTTLLRLIAGTLRPVSGNIRVTDQAITEFPDSELSKFRVRNVGQVFQAFELLNYLTVFENVMLPWYILGEGRRSDALARAKELLASVGLEPKLHARPGELSQGEQQRVAVCRAMFNNPALLLADEPTGNLDGETGEQVIDVLFELAEHNGTTLLLITHDAAIARRCSRVVHLHDGQIIDPGGGGK